MSNLRLIIIWCSINVYKNAQSYTEYQLDRTPYKKSRIGKTSTYKNNCEREKTLTSWAFGAE